MDNQKLINLNRLINNSYECSSFMDFLKLTVMKLHEIVIYDSGMFFCGISSDCSFFKPYVTGSVEEYYKKQSFHNRENYLKLGDASEVGKEALVYKAIDLKQGVVSISDEPRNGFLLSQEDFHIVCIRIVYQQQFMGEIYLHRSKDKPDFSEEDMFVLRLLQPHISTVFHIIHTVTAVKYVETDNGRLSRKGLCLLDGELAIAGGNTVGLDMLKMSTVFGSSVLFHIKEYCREMLSERKEKTCLISKQASVQTDTGSLTVDFILKPDEKNKTGGKFFLSMEFMDGELSVPDYKFKFTKREADIIDGIVQGKNNSQLAAALYLSENTIKTHIQSIYRKAGANNRTELTYILLLNKNK